MLADATEVSFAAPTSVRPIQALRRDFDLYMAHHRMPEMPADNNITENVIGQLNTKLHLMQAFESAENVERYVRLIVGCYRFKRFTDSRNGHNGKSPLELAGVHVSARDWLSFLINH